MVLDGLTYSISSTFFLNHWWMHIDRLNLVSDFPIRKRIQKKIVKTCIKNGMAAFRTRRYLISSS